MNGTRSKLVIAAAAGGLGTFLPWATLGALISVDGTKGDGFITLAFFIAAIVAATRGQRARPMTKSQRIWSTVFGLVAGGVGLINIVNIKSRFGGHGGRLANAISVGFGLYLVVAAGVAVVAIALFGGRSKPIEQSAMPMTIHYPPSGAPPSGVKYAPTSAPGIPPRAGPGRLDPPT
jgi:hypothetical protein